jgi:hypothetical protein
MKYLVAALLMTVTLSEPVRAETAVAPAAKFTVDTPIETLAADPTARIALDANFPGMTTHAMYDQFKSMSLKQLQPMAADQITDAAIAKLATDLAAIK